MMQVIEIKNDDIRVELCDYGARICAIHFRRPRTNLIIGPSVGRSADSDEFLNVVCGYADLQDYLNDEFAMGATMGPITNRIANAELTIEGRHFTLPRNKGQHCLHSGDVGFDRQFWAILEHAEQHVVFGLQFDLECIGMQGSLSCRARYQIKGSELNVHYEVVSDVHTYLNLTNHVYLNLSSGSQRIDDHVFTLFASHKLENSSDSIPTGEIDPIEPPFEYRLERDSVSGFGDEGFDHHFVVRDETNREWRELAQVRSLTTGIGVSILSDAPGFQLYTGNYLSGEFAPQSAFCIEPQSIPDAINNSQFDAMTVAAGAVYARRIAWRFF